MRRIRIVGIATARNPLPERSAGRRRRRVGTLRAGVVRRDGRSAAGGRGASQGVDAAARNRRGGGAGRTVEEARSGLLRGGRLAESRTCAASRRGLSANRQTLFVAAYRTAQATPVRHREDRRDASARGAVRPHRPAGRRHVGGGVGGGGAADVALPQPQCTANGRV